MPEACLLGRDIKEVGASKANLPIPVVSMCNSRLVHAEKPYAEAKKNALYILNAIPPQSISLVETYLEDCCLAII